MAVNYILKQLNFIDLNDIKRNQGILYLYNMLYDTYDIDNLFQDESGKNKGVKFSYTSIDNTIIKRMKEQELSFLTISLYRELRYLMTTSTECFCVRKTQKLFKQIALDFDVELKDIEESYKDLYILNYIIEIKNATDDTFLTCVNAVSNFEQYFHKVIKDRESKREKREKERQAQEPAPSVPLAPAVDFNNPFN